MIDIEKYISEAVDALTGRFGDRLVYVGLQGSYLRGEATEDSDIDIMTVIDDLDISDLAAYRKIIRSMPYADKSCGFICSCEDLKHWNPLEIHHLLNSTADRYGQLRLLVPSYSPEDTRNFIKMSINNMYHELCHRYIHGDPENTVAALPGIYKGVFYILQNKHYLTEGIFVGTKAELLKYLKGLDYEVMRRCVDLSGGQRFSHEENFKLLFTWCQETLHAL